MAHHTLAQFDGAGALLCAFKILDTSGTPTITDVSPPAFLASDLSITDTATGVYDVVIANFKGPLGKTNVQACPYTLGHTAGCTARSYSGNSLSITIKVMDGATPSAADSSVDVMVLAW